MRLGSGCDEIAAVAAEGLAVAALYAAEALRTGAPAVAAAGYAAADAVVWAAARRSSGHASGAPPLASGCRPWARGWGAVAAGIALAALLAAGRLAAGAAEVGGAALVIWGLGWGVRLAGGRAWAVALGGGAAAVGLEALSAGVGPAARAAAGWAAAAVLAAWTAGRAVAARERDVERASAQIRRRAAAHEWEQGLFSLHDLIEREAGTWQPRDWGRRALAEAARLMEAREVRLLAPAGAEPGEWALYAAWPETADAQLPAGVSLPPLEPAERAAGPCVVPEPHLLACAARLPQEQPARGWLLFLRAPWQPPFDASHRRLAERLAQHWDAAVHNVVTYAQNRRRARHLAILHEISRAMARPLQLEPLFETIFQEVARVMPVEAFIITLYDQEKQSLHAAFIVDKGQRYPPVTVPADQGPTAEVVRTGRPLFLNRRPEEMSRPVPGSRLVGAPEEPASVIIVPMTLENRVVGTISAQSYRPSAYTPEDFELLGIIAGQAAIYVQNARLYEQTVQLALTDSMTGLGNARMLRRELARELARARRSGAPLSVIMLDSDHLKQVNDRHGHLVGDRYLALLADLIRAHVRAGDIVTRYAGDEFVVVLPETPPEEAQRVAERIVQAVARTPLTVGQEKVFTSVSAGVASWPGCGDDEEQLLWAADRALYAAKRSGKGRISCLARL